MKLILSYLYCLGSDHKWSSKPRTGLVYILGIANIQAMSKYSEDLNRRPEGPALRNQEGGPQENKSTYRYQDRV